MKNAQLERLRVQKLWSSFYRPKYLAFLSAYSFHFSGRSSSAKMADTGHTGTHAPQSMHSTGSMNSMSVPSNCGSSFFRMDTIHRTCIHAGRVLGPDARLCNHICHRSKDLRISISCMGQPSILTAIVERANFSAERQSSSIKRSFC